jgi:phage terminase large subunit-like protein
MPKAKPESLIPDADALLRSLPRGPLPPAMQYCRDVLSGKVLAGELVKLAVARHLRDLGKAKRDKKYPYFFDAAAAQFVIDYIQTFCCHSKGEWAGQPIALQPWQQFGIWCIFGWKRRDTKTRRFTTAYWEVARKNGKTTKFAALGNYLMHMDGEQGAEVYAAATKKDQARILWEEAKRMVLRSPHLKSVIKAYRNNLHIPASNSKFEPLSSDENSLDGLNPHAALIDELHAHKTRDLVDVLNSAFGARRQPLEAYITTAGFNRDSVCWEKRDYSIKVLRGIFDGDSHFAIIFTLDEEDIKKKRYFDERLWVKANPNLGISVKLDYLRKQADDAKKMPGSLNNFLTKHLNIWTSQKVAWMNMQAWDECGDPLDLTELENDPCFGALDLSSTQDLTSFVLLFPPAGKRDRWAVLPFFWIPEETMRDRIRLDHVPYDVWQKQGYVYATEGNVVDYDAIRRRISGVYFAADDVDKFTSAHDPECLADRFAIQEIAFDDWNATQITTQLAGDGLTMVNFGQGYKSMNAPMKQVERDVLDRKLMHGGNPVLRWNMSNVTAKTDPAGNVKPDKGVVKTQRIDGVVALIMARGRAMVGDNGPSVYETRGVISL